MLIGFAMYQHMCIVIYEAYGGPEAISLLNKLSFLKLKYRTLSPRAHHGLPICKTYLVSWLCKMLAQLC